VNPIARHTSRLSTALVLTLLVACGGLPGDDLLLGPKDVGASGGVVYSLDGKAYVVVPPGAISLDQTVRISVEKVDASPPASFGTAVGVAYRFEPSGTLFNSLVTLHTKYDEDDLPPGVAADDLDLVLQSGATGLWARMTEVVTNPEQQTISGKTSHFSVAAQVFEGSELPSFEGFHWPFAGGSEALTITQAFGQYEEVADDRYHAGVDIQATVAEAEVLSIGPGVVWKIVRYDKPIPTDRCERMPGSSDEGTDCGMFGNAVMIRHDNGLYSIYGHLASIGVLLGHRVGAGTRLGTEGNSNTKVRHLHLELRTFDEWSYPDASDGESGNGYTVRHPHFGGSGAHYIDPLRAMPELADAYEPESPPLVVRTIANGVGANLRPVPGHGYMGGTSYRADDGQSNHGLKLDETLEVVATATVATSLVCETWYEVRPVADVPYLTRWVREAGEDGELYFLVTRLARAGSSVRTAWVCARDDEGDLFVKVGDDGDDDDDDPVGAPAWSVSPTALAFVTPAGVEPIAPRTLVVENTGDAAGTVHVSIDYGAAGGSWLAVSPPSRTLNAGEGAAMTVSVDGCTGSAGLSATIGLSGGGDATQVPVTLTCREPAGDVEHLGPRGRSVLEHVPQLHAQQHGREPAELGGGRERVLAPHRWRCERDAPTRCQHHRDVRPGLRQQRCQPAPPGHAHDDPRVLRSHGRLGDHPYCSDRRRNER